MWRRQQWTTNGNGSETATGASLVRAPKRAGGLESEESSVVLWGIADCGLGVRELLVCCSRRCGKNFSLKSGWFSIIPPKPEAVQLRMCPATWLQQNNFAGSFVKLMAGI